jgi:hypothetical protein
VPHRSQPSSGGLRDTSLADAAYLVTAFRLGGWPKKVLSRARTSRSTSAGRAVNTIFCRPSVRSLRSYKKASSTRVAMTPAPRFSCGEGITYRRYELEAKVVPVELGVCRPTSAFRHGSYSPVVSRQRGRLCKARPAAMRPHRQGGLSGVGSRLAAAGRHCRRVGETTSFVGVNPCASFSDVECFNTKQLQLEPRRTLDRKVGGCGCGPRNTSA